MKDFINYLERMIDGCESLKGMEREKAVYQSVLKKYRSISSVKLKYEIEDLKNHLNDLSSKTDRFIHRGKINEIKKIIHLFNKKNGDID